MCHFWCGHENRASVCWCVQDERGRYLYLYVYHHSLPSQGQEEVMDLLQAAPFQNMYPRPFVKG